MERESHFSKGTRVGPRRARNNEIGMGLVDVLVAACLLIVILVPAAQILMTSGKVVGDSKAQAVAGSLAAAQIAQDRATWTSITTAPSYSSSNCGSGYSSSSVNATYDLYLTSCKSVGGMNFWVFQNGGWCVTSSTSTLKTSGTGTEPLFWVEAMVTWGGSTPPSPNNVVSAQNRLVMSSALQTPNGYYTNGSTTGSCPL